MTTVLVSDDGRVRTLLMHRPERLNAFDGSLVNDLLDALNAAAADPNVGVIVLSGSGRAFSTGADLKMLERSPDEPSSAEPGGFDRLLFAMADLEKPLLMAVNGFAVGFGMTILAFADAVFMSTEARLRCPFTELGAPTEAASSFLFPKLLGRQHASWILLSSEWISGEEAYEMGLAWKLCAPEELMDVADDHAQRLAARSNEALGRVKRLMNAPERAELAAAIEREAEELERFVRSFARSS